MPNVAAASALLTAESLVIAAISIGIQRLPELEDPHQRLATRLVILMGVNGGLSFAFTLMYLHKAEFPQGALAPFPAQIIFNMSLFSLLLLTYIGFGPLLFAAMGKSPRFIFETTFED